MSELISADAALKELLCGKKVERSYKSEWEDLTADDPIDVFFTSESFRLKPRTVNLNGIEVPAPFDGSLKHKQYAYVLNTASPDGYSSMKFYEGGNQPLICWTDEEEIKQVVAALPSIFNPQ